MKANELREKSVEELNQDLLGLLKEQFNLRLRKSTGQLNQEPYSVISADRIAAGVRRAMAG